MKQLIGWTLAPLGLKVCGRCDRLLPARGPSNCESCDPLLQELTANDARVVKDAVSWILGLLNSSREYQTAIGRLTYEGMEEPFGWYIVHGDIAVPADSYLRLTGYALSRNLDEIAGQDQVNRMIATILRHLGLKTCDTCDTVLQFGRPDRCEDCVFQGEPLPLEGGAL